MIGPRTGQNTAFDRLKFGRVKDVIDSKEQFPFAQATKPRAMRVGGLPRLALHIGPKTARR